jgi:hypothetical protein
VHGGVRKNTKEDLRNGEGSREYPKEEMDLIMMDDEKTREIIRNAGLMHNRRPYRYRMNNKKRVVVE